MRRLRKVAVAGSLVADLVGLGTGSAIPAERFGGMRLVGARYDAFADTLWLLFEHPEFAAVPEGAEPPAWEPVFLRREASVCKCLPLGDGSILHSSACPARAQRDSDGSGLAR